MLPGKPDTHLESGEDFVCLRWIRYERVEGERLLYDVMEQEILCRFPETIGEERWERFFRAWRSVMTEVMEVSLNKMKSFVPVDFLSRSILSAVELKRAETEEDFKKALRGKSRLGKFLEE